MNGLVDLTRTDTYPNGQVPEQDIETCMKVLRTIAERWKQPDRVQLDAADDVILAMEAAHVMMVTLGKGHNKWVKSREG